MTTDEIHAAAIAAADEAEARWWNNPQESTATSGAELKALRVRAAIDAVAPLLITQGRREAAEQLRREANRYSPNVLAEARACMQEAARIAEGGTP